MKAEVFKVKISKLREVKRQLKKGKNKNELSLKKLLLSESIEQRENNILYKSISAVFQDDEINEDFMKASKSPEISDYHVDFDELLKSLDLHQTNILSVKPSSSLTEKESNIKSEGNVVCNINQTDGNYSRNSLNYTIYTEKNDSDQCRDELYFYNQVDTESILWCSNISANFNTEISINNARWEPSMVGLGQIYAPDIELCADNEVVGINEEGFCNEIKISTTTVNMKTEKEIEADVTENLDTTENILVNPMEDNCSGVDLKVIAKIQLPKQSNNINEADDLIESELLVLGPLMVETVSPILNPQLTAGGFETATPTLANKLYCKTREI